MKTQNIIYSMLAMIMATLLSASLASCSDDDKTPSDPQGTASANIRNDDANIYATIPMGTFSYIDKDGETQELEASVRLDIDGGNNFFLRYNDRYNKGISSYGSTINKKCIVSVGAVKGLGSIKNIPENGWAEKVAVQPGHGYIIKYESEVISKDIKGDIYYLGHPDNEFQTIVRYARFYVDEWMENTYGGIIGASVKYQGDWIIEK